MTRKQQAIEIAQKAIFEHEKNYIVESITKLAESICAERRQARMKIENEEEYFNILSKDLMSNEPIIYAWFQKYRHGAPLLDCLIGTIKSLAEAKKEISTKYLQYVHKFGSIKQE